MASLDTRRGSQDVTAVTPLRISATFRVAQAPHRFTERVPSVSPAVLLGVYFEWIIVIELGTSHATFLPDAAVSEQGVCCQNVHVCLP
jgi:hypothetical protein